MTAPRQYHKKPATIEAIQWDGTADGATAIIEWVGGDATYWVRGARDPGAPDMPYIAIATWLGDLLACPGDWIIRGVAGEFYPRKPLTAREAVAVIRDLHVRHDDECDECGQAWPCDTAMLCYTADEIKRRLTNE